jgi:hypothetical protein
VNINFFFKVDNSLRTSELHSSNTVSGDTLQPVYVVCSPCTLSNKNAGICQISLHMKLQWLLTLCHVTGYTPVILNLKWHFTFVFNLHICVNTWHIIINLIVAKQSYIFTSLRLKILGLQFLCFAVFSRAKDSRRYILLQLSGRVSVILGGFFYLCYIIKFPWAVLAINQTS